MPMQSEVVTVEERSDIDVAAQMFRGFGDPTRLAILTELLAVRRSRKLNELTLSDINHAIRSGYSGATNAAVSEPEADVKLGKDKVITLGDVSVTVERE